MRVMVVDDHEDVADSLAGLVQSWGYECSIAYDGYTAINKAKEWLQETHPKQMVILLDIMMPQLDGFAVSKQLRSLLGPRGPEGALIIGVTALGDECYKYKGYDHGFDYYLVKPVDPQRIKKILQTTARSLEVAEEAEGGIDALVRQLARREERKNARLTTDKESV